MYKIPESWGEKRRPRTPVAQRKNIITHGLTYDEIFDFDTLFADAVQLGDGRVLLIGPPLYELRKHLKFSDGIRSLPHEILSLDKVDIVLVETSASKIWCTDLEIEVEHISNDFDGVGCITTMQKNEPIHWIKDWIEYYNKEHGVKGFCIYDNNSTDYTVEELQAALDDNDLDVIVKVVNWNMPKGPNTPAWDSDFSRYVMFEHFKYKYAWCARYALNHDVDELLMMKEGTLDGLVNDLYANRVAGLIYGNRNIEPYNERLDVAASELPIEERRFADYWYYSNYNNTNNTKVGKRLIEKWIAIPENAMEIQWRNHDFNGDGRIAKADRVSGLYFAHFYAMQSMIKNHHPSFHNRNKQVVDKGDIMVDETVKRKLQRIWSS